jgi:hypothetical protein
MMPRQPVGESRTRCQFRQKDVLEDERAAVPLRKLPFRDRMGNFVSRRPNPNEYHLYDFSQADVHIGIGDGGTP